MSLGPGCQPSWKILFGLEVLWCFPTGVIAGDQLWACFRLNVPDPECHGKFQQLSLLCSQERRPQDVKRKVTVWKWGGKRWRNSIMWWGKGSRSIQASQIRGGRPKTLSHPLPHTTNPSVMEIHVLVARVRSVWPCAKLFGLSSLIFFPPSTPEDRLVN